jgi:hypothetical protein
VDIGGVLSVSGNWGQSFPQRPQGSQLQKLGERWLPT